MSSSIEVSVTTTMKRRWSTTLEKNLLCRRAYISSHSSPSENETGLDKKLDSDGYSSSDQHRLGLAPVLPALISSLVIGSMASLLLAWVFTRRITSHSSDEDTFFHSAVVVAEGRQSGVTKFLGQMLGTKQTVTANTETTMYVLAMSSVAVHTVSFTAPLVLGVFGYWMAANWIRSQERQRRNGLPTPTQYGLIVGLLGSPNFMSVFDTVSYISRKGRARPATPPILVLSLVVVVVFLFINYALWICDLWFHTASSTFSHQFLAPISPNALPQIASVINRTLCSGPVKAYYHFLPDFGSSPPTTINAAGKYANCVHVAGEGRAHYTTNRWGTVGIISEGKAIVDNSSVLSQVAVVDNVAVLLPKTMPKDVHQLLFDSFALGVKCAPVTNCVGSNSKTVGNTLFCPSFSPPLNISKTDDRAQNMVQQFNLSTNEMFWMPRKQDGGYHGESSINPAGALVALYWGALDKATYNLTSADNTTGWYVWRDTGAFVYVNPNIYAFYVASCQVAVYDVTLSYSSPSRDMPSSLSLANKPRLSNFNTSSAFLGALDPNFQETLASHISDVLHPSLNTSNFNDYLITALAGNLSVSMLGFTAPLAMRARALEGSSATQLPVSRYPLAPFGTLLALLYGYAFISLALCSGAILLKSRHLQFFRLTSARASIADRFGLRASQDSDDSITMRNVIFEEGKDTGRLGMGMARDITEELKNSDDGTEEGVIGRKVQRFKVDYSEEFRVDE
ncbi:hypothetical protein AAF712_006795 [Marasmius tenuissimus]|uniref:Uncharacterized protein n=1 Tax=Marasmius tenuissimus TaxID=585030 RepID=A0ABR2ZY27_9AGAR